MAFSFNIQKKMGRARAGTLTTPHGAIETPAFVTVGTKATVKALTPEEVATVGAQVVLANTYHLYLEPGDEIVRDAGGIHKFMNWHGPTMTDSGGFQVFSLGSAFGKGASKIAERGAPPTTKSAPVESDDGEATSVHESLAKIDEEGVSFKSVIDGSQHRFTPERSIEIQHNIGADMIFAFDECTSPHAPYEYQREAMDRTHRWARRSLAYHKTHVKRGLKDATGAPLQALFGIVQGGRHEDLRKESAKIIGSMEVDGVGFDGFGIGGSFDKEDMYSVVGWVSDILPEHKPRHLLGIGEPADLFGGIENGADLFDCVAATRIARSGSLYTRAGQININNAKYKTDFGKIDGDSLSDESCVCYTCTNYTPAYLSHLFRSKEMLAATLASIHNVYFIVNLVKKIRASIIDGTFQEFKTGFLKKYYK
jgi:queuine tRNA-ribosyltransferase